MALKAIKPEVKEKRLKLFLFGEAGVGKTLAALQFPNSYVVDTEKGTDFYANVINKQNSAVFQTLNPDDIKEEVKQLLTTKHPYKTLIIDPITQVYNATQEKWTRIFEKYTKSEKEGEIQDFGMRYWAKVKGDFKGLQRLMLQLDMNVIVTSHQKDVYGSNFSKIGVTFDSMRGDDYFFDLVFRISKKGGERIAETIKERAEIGQNKFPPEFVWSYDNFCKFYGKNIIEKESTPVSMATKEQVEMIKALIETVKVDEADINKWFAKADVAEWDEMTSEQIQKCIDFVNKKLGVVLPTEQPKEKKVSKK